MHHVPRVRAQLVFHLRDEAGPADEHDALLAPEQHAQQGVEAGEVIHVRVADEHMRHAHQLAWRQHADVAEIEQQRPPFVAKVDVQARVAERAVDQAGFEQVAHAVGRVSRLLCNAFIGGRIDRTQAQRVERLPSLHIGSNHAAMPDKNEVDARRRGWMGRALAAVGTLTALPLAAAPEGTGPWHRRTEAAA